MDGRMDGCLHRRDKVSLAAESLSPSHLGLVPLVAVGWRALAVGLAVHLHAGGAEAALQLVA